MAPVLIDIIDNLPVTLHVMPEHPLTVTRAGAERMGFCNAWDLLDFLQSRGLCAALPYGDRTINLLNVALAAQEAFLTDGGFLSRIQTGDIILSQEQWVYA